MSKTGSKGQELLNLRALEVSIVLMESSRGTSREAWLPEGLEVNSTTPKQHHPDLALSQMELGVGRTVQSLLGAGGHCQDALLFANENPSLLSAPEA